jgi:hypothetical protein
VVELEGSGEPGGTMIRLLTKVGMGTGGAWLKKHETWVWSAIGGALTAAYLYLLWTMPTPFFH